MQGVKDRSITLHQYLAYTDGNMTEVFKSDIKGKITHEVRGKSEKSPNMTVTALALDKGKTIAEVFEQGTEALAARYKDRADAWHDFIEWYKKFSSNE